jgi:hypothetical protein
MDRRSTGYRGADGQTYGVPGHELVVIDRKLRVQRPTRHTMERSDAISESAQVAGGWARNSECNFLLRVHMDCHDPSLNSDVASGQKDSHTKFVLVDTHWTRARPAARSGRTLLRSLAGGRRRRPAGRTPWGPEARPQGPGPIYGGPAPTDPPRTTGRTATPKDANIAPPARSRGRGGRRGPSR